MTPAIPRLFVLRRDKDVTGVSGPGDVADGVQWPDGTVDLRWRDRPSTSIWQSLGLMLSVHGHDGATRVVWLDEEQEQRARTTADIAQLFDVPLDAVDLDDREYLRDRLGRALATAAESSTRGGEGGEARWVHLTGDRDQFVNAVMPVVDQLLEQRNRARCTAGRAYQLADRWEAAHGSSMFLVRAAGAELRDELDGADECDHRLMPMFWGLVPGGPCVVRGPHTDHRTADGTKFTPLVPAPNTAATQATDRTCTSACQGVTGIRGLLEHVGIDTRGRDISVAGRVVDAAAEPCTRHHGAERERYGCNGPDPADVEV